MSRIILASGSPRRSELLKQVGLDFEVNVSKADENIETTEPKKMVKELSARKAKEVYERVKKKYKSGLVVIGADTVVSVDGRILGKPKDRKEAYAMIESIAGREHQVYTGVTVITGKKTVTFASKTKVEVYKMTGAQIQAYVDTGDCDDKAGAYGIQGSFAAYIKGIRGDYNNVVGLPVGKLCNTLRKMNLM